MNLFIRLLKYFLQLIKDYFNNLYLRHQAKLTSGYWFEKWTKIKEYDWRNPKWTDFKGIFKVALKIVFLFLKVAIVLFVIVYLGILGRMPSKSELKAKQNNTASEVYSSDSVLLGRYFIQDRTNVKYKDIAEDVFKALVATEDVRFYKHKGIDYRSLGRVFVKSLLLQDESSGGGSTISQQLAKNLYPRKDYKIFSTSINKLQEMIIARRLESVYSKEEVLELYLNTVPLGGNLFGIERASWRFFNKPAKKLKLEEATVLIGMLKATTTYNPRLSPDKSKARRNVVINQMVKYGYLEKEKAEKIKSLPLNLDYNFSTHSEGIAPYFREMLRLELVKWCSTKKKKNGDPYNLYTDGLKIYTTIDSRLQLYAEASVRKKMSILQKEFDDHWQGKTPWGKDGSIVRAAIVDSDRYKKLKEQGKSEEQIAEIFKEPVPMQLFRWKGSVNKTMSPIDSIRYYQKFLNAGLLSIESKTGYVRAWVGGINHKVFKYDHVRSKRQVGSTFKPIVYAAALETGIEPCSYFPNKLVSYPAYDNWTPKNADGQYGGEYSMRGALAHSVNTISAQVVMQAGIKETINLAQGIGIKSKLPEVPSIALGVAEISLFEMVNAYSTFANEGYRVDPILITKIIDRQGKVIREDAPEFGKKAISFETSQVMLKLMQGVVEEGSAARLRSEYGLNMDIAGKTGTTQDQTDGWFIGITPDLITGVWVGGENRLVRFRSLALGQGSHMALPIWGDYMVSLTRDKNFKTYKNSSFPPLPPHVLDKLNCESYRMEAPPKENIIERVFNDLFGGNRKSKEEREQEMARKEKEREQRWAAYRKAKEERKRKKKERKKNKLW